MRRLIAKHPDGLAGYDGDPTPTNNMATKARGRNAKAFESNQNIGSSQNLCDLGPKSLDTPELQSWQCEAEVTLHSTQ